MHGFKLSDKFEICEFSAISKARQMNVNMFWSGSSNITEDIDMRKIQERREFRRLFTDFLGLDIKRK
jgi:hypothetical protein